MDIGDFRGLLTALLFVSFVGIWIWSWSKKRKPDFDAAANMPLEDGSKPPPHNETREESR